MVEAHVGRSAMNAREEILAAVRRALDGAERGDVAVPRGYRSAVPEGDVVDLFCERVAEYKAVVVRCPSADVPVRVGEALGHAGRVLVPAGLSWDVPAAVPDSGLSPRELDELDAVVTEASVGVAETGTVVLTHGAGQGRRALTLVPDVHVCILRASQVVATVPDAMASWTRRARRRGSAARPRRATSS
jgi:L-lactate dehydrogenase complex protein LldG